MGNIPGGEGSQSSATGLDSCSVLPSKSPRGKEHEFIPQVWKMNAPLHTTVGQSGYTKADHYSFERAFSTHAVQLARIRMSSVVPQVICVTEVTESGLLVIRWHREVGLSHGYFRNDLQDCISFHRAQTVKIQRAIF